MGKCTDCVHTNVCMNDKNLIGDVFALGNTMFFDNDKLYQDFLERQKNGFPCKDFLSIDRIKESDNTQ